MGTVVRMIKWVRNVPIKGGGAWIQQHTAAGRQTSFTCLWIRRLSSRLTHSLFNGSALLFDLCIGGSLLLSTVSLLYTLLYRDYAGSSSPSELGLASGA